MTFLYSPPALWLWSNNLKHTSCSQSPGWAIFNTLRMFWLWCKKLSRRWYSVLSQVIWEFLDTYDKLNLAIITHIPPTTNRILSRWSKSHWCEMWVRGKNFRINSVFIIYYLIIISISTTCPPPWDSISGVWWLPAVVLTSRGII